MEHSPEALASLVSLGHALRTASYRFVTVTPETHRRVLARRAAPARTLRDVFGWGLPFERGTLPSPVGELLAAAGALQPDGAGLFRSAVRFSSLGGQLYVHSAYPTLEPDAVFFGPDTWRFCAAIERADREAKRVVDVGCGTGAGGIVASKRAARLVLGDVNEDALFFAKVNCTLAGVEHVEIIRSDVLAGVDGPIDYVVANPPYLVDEARRVYRDGGGAFGEGLALRIVREAADRLSPGGTLLLYTGAPVVDGRDVLFEEARSPLERRGAQIQYEELDPDVFGEELDRPCYATVERIAAVVLTATMPPR